MKRYLKLGWILLGIWLIAAGAAELLAIGHPTIALLLRALAVATGVVILTEVRSMGTVERIGMILLAVWLILVGLMPYIGMGLPYGSEIAMVLALLAGILLLVGIRDKRKAAKLGIVLLAIWLIVKAALQVIDPPIPAADTILAALEIIAGILILIWR